jgi:hypothetical protein
MIQPAMLSQMLTIDQFVTIVPLPLYVYGNGCGREDEARDPPAIASPTGNPICRRFGCPDGVWVGWNVSDVQGAFVAK